MAGKCPMCGHDLDPSAKGAIIVAMTEKKPSKVLTVQACLGVFLL